MNIYPHISMKHTNTKTRVLINVSNWHPSHKYKATQMFPLDMTARMSHKKTVNTLVLKI
jgi:hypothetical protein